jgi:hypothetical protein
VVVTALNRLLIVYEFTWTYLYLLVPGFTWIYLDLPELAPSGLIILVCVAVYACTYPDLSQVEGLFTRTVSSSAQVHAVRDWLAKYDSTGMTPILTIHKYSTNCHAIFTGNPKLPWSRLGHQLVYVYVSFLLLFFLGRLPFACHSRALCCLIAASFLPYTCLITVSYMPYYHLICAVLLPYYRLIPTLLLRLTAALGFQKNVEPHDVARALLDSLYDLEDPLLTSKLHDAFGAAISKSFPKVPNCVHRPV